MSGPERIPAGFTVEQAPGLALVARPVHLPALLGAGLLDPRAWERACSGAEIGGRGPTGTLTLDDALVLHVKRMRRGGLARHVWRDRFPGTRRLLANLVGPITALDRGVATVEPIALLIERGPLGLSRGWLAARNVADARSLAQRLVSRDPPSRDELRAVVAVVRAMHERGIDHRDLNLGNVLLRDRSRPPAALVIDLDRARIGEHGLPVWLRARAMRRLERSTVKLLGPRPRLSGVDLRRFWYEAYAEQAPDLAARLERARRFNRWAIALHRLGWTGSRAWTRR